MEKFCKIIRRKKRQIFIAEISNEKVADHDEQCFFQDLILPRGSK